MKLHQATHPTYQEGCYACRIASVSFAQSAMPTRYPQANQTTAREKRWERDIPAYKRLRKNGVQPKCIDGSGDFETMADERFELETGRIVAKSARSRFKEGLAMVAEA